MKEGVNSKNPDSGSPKQEEFVSCQYFQGDERYEHYLDERFADIFPHVFVFALVTGRTWKKKLSQQ